MRSTAKGEEHIRREVHPAVVHMNDLEFHPVSMDRWADLTAFFEQHGNTNYCWCMRWRLKSTQFKQLTAAGRRNREW